MNAAALLPTIDFAQRFEEATRAGQPEWLWFEVPETRWAAALATIETALRDMLTSGRSAGKLIDDPVALSVACYTSGTGPLLGSWVEQGLLATTAANAGVLLLHLEHNRARMAKLTARTMEAVEALSAAGATPIVIKGMHTAHRYFDEPGQRVASDIDLLLHPGEQTIAEQALAGLGYGPRTSSYRQRSWARSGVADHPVTLTYVHRDDPWSIDLHESVTRKLAGGSRMADIDALVPLVALDPWPVSHRANVFPPPLLLIHLLVHASCSFESLTLQRQYEICLVVQKNGGRDGFDWLAFEAFCERADLWPFLYPALRCAELLATDLVPDPIMLRSRRAAPAQVRKLIEGHSAAFAHRVGRWSWTERFMWADGFVPRLRQLVDELRLQDRLSLNVVKRVWKRRLYRQVGRIVPRTGEPARGAKRR